MKIKGRGSPRMLMLTFYSSSRTTKRKEQTQKGLRAKITHVVEELKKT